MSTSEILNFILYIAFAIAIIRVLFMIARWVSGVKHIMQNNERQTLLLKKMADKQGVSNEEIDEIMS